MAVRLLSTKSVDGVCDLCCRDSEGWAVGPCDHPVCYLCATKMRVLCEQNECAVCRSEMNKVVFSATVKPFKSYKLISMPCDEKYSVYFQSDTLRQSYLDVLRFICPIANCSMEFGNMRKLNSHTRKEHNLHYCQICMDHLKLFPYERKLYLQSELVRHNRQGDPDDTSHKGHPMCKFCNQRYFDKDQLHSHLHKVHFWCHFCEGDGKQDYYVNYNELKKHFRLQHYLCEQDECAHKEIESAFKTKIDFQAHVLNVHGQKMSKSQSKQKKQIDQIQLGFRYDRSSGNKNGDDEHDVTMEQKGVNKRYPASHRKREDSEMTRALALSLAESDKSSDKSSRKNDTTDSQEPPTISATAIVAVDAPPGLKKKQSGNTNEPQDFNSLTLAPEPPPGFKKKQSNYESDFPVTIKAPESLPSVPSLSYGNLVGNNLTNQAFPTLSDASTVDKTIAPPPGFEKKMSTSTLANPQPEKKEPIIKRLRQLLQNDENFEQFKTCSGNYRRHEISAEEYENICNTLFGDQQWNSVFDELVATFPDEQGQDDLIKAHQNRKTKATKKSKAKRHNYRPVTAWGVGNSAVGDRMDDELYPPLSGTALVQPPPAKWGHKVAVK